jgi:hypothetical protein
MPMPRKTHDAEKVSVAFVGCACTMNDRVLNIPKVREILLLSDQACNNSYTRASVQNASVQNATQELASKIIQKSFKNRQTSYNDHPNIIQTSSNNHSTIIRERDRH